jgi:MYXO-CTERM domain-containing protein
VCDTTTSKCESATAAGYVAAGGGCQAGRADAGDLDAAWVGLVGLAVFGVRRRRRDPQSR